MLSKQNQKIFSILCFFLLALLITSSEALLTMAQQEVYLNNVAKTSNLGYDVCIEGNYAFVTHNDGFDIFDITNPYKPVKTSSFEINNGAFGIVVENDLAYVSCQNEGLIIANVTYKTDSSLIGQTSIGGIATRAFVHENYVYVASYENGLQIVDISNINTPFVVGSYFDVGRIDCIWAVGDYAYVANPELGLEILDISTRHTPSKISTLTTLAGVCDLFLCEDLLFASSYSSSVYVMNISTGNNPVYVGSHSDNDDGEAQGVVGNRTHIFVADNYGVEYLNISNLPQITEVAENRRGISSAHDVDFKDNFIFIAGGSVGVGLMVFEISDTEKTNIGYYVGIPTALVITAVSAWLVVRSMNKKKENNHLDSSSSSSSSSLSS